MIAECYNTMILKCYAFYTVKCSVYSENVLSNLRDMNALHLLDCAYMHA